MARALAFILLSFAAIVAVYWIGLRPDIHPLLVDASFHRAGGDFCDINPQTQSEPLERPRGVIHGRPASENIA